MAFWGCNGFEMLAEDYLGAMAGKKAQQEGHMSEKGNLYKTMSVRFSLLDQEHIKTYQQFSSFCEEHKLSRNQN